MKTSWNFKKRLFSYLILIFITFSALVLIFQIVREKQFKRSQLENTLDHINDITNNFLQQNKILSTRDFSTLNELIKIFPKPLVRITIIDSSGVVLYDNEINDVTTMENHLGRPEIQKSIHSLFGANIRTSSSTNEVYYYYAKRYTNCFIRAAVVYDKNIINYLKVDRIFIFFILTLFFIMWIVLVFISNKFGKTVDKLKDFIIRLDKGEEIEEKIDFPDNEFGMISRQIINLYNELKTTKDKITFEKEKLNSHLYALNEGVAFFSAKKEKILTNNFFIQFLNIISEKSNISAEKIFETAEFQPILNFVVLHTKSKKIISPDHLPQMDHSIHKNGRYFNIKCIVFPDNGFEIIITDITQSAKRKLIKQQMTSNISHELKTPVAAVMGYLETLKNTPLEKEKQSYFIEKAFSQANRLKELINDIQVLNKIEEADEKFVMGSLILREIIDEALDSLKMRLDENHVLVKCDIDNHIMVEGNRSLLFSVFHNLIDNSIKYAGEKISISISKYDEDQNYYYLSLSDNGSGIPEEHFSRIFERFYRIDSGRSRKTGGTGLGLAIVKNAILLHHGNISARNTKDGGLEFLFTLKKGYSQLAIKY